MVEGLAIADPLVEGAFTPARLGHAGETLTTEPADDGLREVPADEPDRLQASLAEHAASLGEVPDPVAAASWSNHLTTLLVPGLVAAWSLHDVAIDASASNLALQTDDGRPVRWRIRDPTRVDRDPSARQRTIATLTQDTLTPLFIQLQAETGLSEDVGWAHVGNIVAYLFDRLAEAGLVEADSADRRALLAAEDPAWWEGSNPLQGRISYERIPGQATPDTYQVRQPCCLKREIPSKAPCASCPHIEADRRAELIAERRRQA